MVNDATERRASDAFTFTGSWRDYAPIALSNLALSVVTLGIYRFWAAARERRYLWSHTIFIDDRLEWTGTGKEMFIGFLIAVAVLLVPLFLLSAAAQTLLLSGQALLGFILLIALYAFALLVAGLAQFRALRYRLSRTYWHGVRGGSPDSGKSYCVSAIWKPVAGALAFGLLIPRAMVSLWNERWNKMEFGPYRFSSNADYSGLWRRWLLVMATPVVAVIILAIIAAATGLDDGRSAEASPVFSVLLAVIVYLTIIVGSIVYYAKYFRRVVGGLSLDALGFEFRARTVDFVKLLLGDVALVVGTLGIGIAFLGYRHWRFFVDHTGVTGWIDIASMTQSTARVGRDAEGLADAFDIGAF